MKRAACRRPRKRQPSTLDKWKQDPGGEKRFLTEGRQSSKIMDSKHTCCWSQQILCQCCKIRQSAQNVKILKKMDFLFYLATFFIIHWSWKVLSTPTTAIFSVNVDVVRPALFYLVNAVDVHFTALFITPQWVSSCLSSNNNGFLFSSKIWNKVCCIRSKQVKDKIQRYIDKFCNNFFFKKPIPEY